MNLQENRKIPMKQTAFVCVVVIALGAGTACIASKESYVAKGNKLYDAGKYVEASLSFRKAIQKDPNFGEAYYRLGLADIKQGQGSEAYDALYRAAQLLPDRTEVAVELGDVVLAGYLANPRRPQRLYDQLTGISKRLVSANPNSFDGLRFQGDIALSERQYERANALFAKANAVQPMRPKLIGPWVESLIENGQSSEAEKLAWELIRSHPDYSPIYDLLYYHYMKSGRPSDAESLLKTKIANNPEDKNAILQLASFYSRLQRSTEVSGALQKLIDRPKAFPQADAEIGDFYAARGNWEEALRYFKMGLHDSPQDKILYEEKITNVLLAQGKTQDAVGTLSQILNEQPKNLSARGMRAVVLLNEGKQLDVALKELQALVKELPADEILRFNLGRAYLRTGDLKSAHTEFLGAANRRKDYIAPRIGLAALGESTEDYAETVQYSEEVLSIVPNQRDAQKWLCVGLIGTGAYTRARSELNALLRDSPESTEFQLLLGRLDLAEKKYKDAEVVFRKLYRPGRSDTRPLEGLVEVYLGQNQIAPAVQLVKSELTQSPNSAVLHGLSARLAARSGDLNQAIVQYQWVISNDPRNVDAYVRQSVLYHAKGDRGQALARLQDARKLQPENPKVLAQLAFEESSQNHYAAALEDSRHQLALAPDDPLAMNNLAFILADSGGNVDEALRLISAAAHKLPRSPGILDTLGWVYMKKNMNDSAVRVLSDLVKEYPNEAEFRYHLGVALLQKGDKAKGKAELQIGLSKQPQLELADKIKKAIAKT
jgi:tetratricopeptide (TPR) repeat protein